MLKNRVGKIEFSLGLLLIAVALVLVGYNLFLTSQADSASRRVLGALDQVAPHSAMASSGKDVPDFVLNPQMPMPVRQVDGFDYVCIINLPTLNLRLPVLSEYVYDNLRIAPSRYAGSVYTKNMVICAHNYATHFGNLKDLTARDRLTITDMDGNVFTYEVREITVVDPYQSEEFTDNGYDLTLFTCTVSGASRVLVRCDMVDPKITGR